MVFDQLCRETDGTQIITEITSLTKQPFVPLKWAGGKRWLVPKISLVWEANASAETRLVEPFAGGLSVAIGLRPKTALLNDVNPHVVNFYRWVKKGAVLSVPYKNSATSYAQARKRFNKLVAENGRWTKEAASIFYYLNRHCFNGLCRFNASGQFNVPFGRYKTVKHELDLSSLSAIMKNWDLPVGDFSKLKIESDDFIYADPPYDVEFTSYSKQGFNWVDQERLAEWLSGHSGPVLASNQATDRIVKLYKKLGFKVLTLSAPRRISCDGNRTPAEEMIAYRNLRYPSGAA